MPDAARPTEAGLPAPDLAPLAADGAFEGYASLFNRADLGRDVVLPGAFRETLRRRGAGGIRMLFQHDPAEPIGVWDTIAEDARGLLVRGRLTAGVARAREVLALLRAGAVDGLSIGFKAVRAHRDRPAGVRRIAEIDLWEISIVTFPMLPGARVTRLAAGPPRPAVAAASRALAGEIRAAAVRMHGRLERRGLAQVHADPARAAIAGDAELAGERALLALMRLGLAGQANRSWPSSSARAGKANFNPAQARLPRGQPGGGQWTDEGGGSDRVQPAQLPGRDRRIKPIGGGRGGGGGFGGGGRPPASGHNKPPKDPPAPLPVPPILPPSELDERPRLLDENGRAAPRGFDRLDDLNAFKQRLAEGLPGDVTAVMQGSAVERGGARFRDTDQGGEPASDFDVSLSGTDLYRRAAEAFPGFSKFDRVGPLKQSELDALGIDVRAVERVTGRKTRYMIYPSQIELYRRGPGYPLVVR